MNIGLIIRNCILGDKILLGIFLKVRIPKSSVSFRILNSRTNRIFISRISLQINEIPKT